MAQVLFNKQTTALGYGGITYANGTLGGGISFFDFDNDGWDDITVTSKESSLDLSSLSKRLPYRKSGR
ncbi:MAG: hypothetical protein HKO54_02820 [Flavobacteriaceae bacterium]|nr:hypothetical protein [Flavobacteriaceae bacterium]